MLKYIIPFKTLSNISCEIRLEEANYSGEPIELKAGAVPFSIQIDESDLITPVRSSGATIEVYGSDYLHDLYTSDPQGIKVILLVGNTVKWLGYLTPDTFSQDFSSPEFIYEMEAVAALSTLKYKEFDLTDDFVTFREIVAQAVVYTGYEFAYITNSVRTVTGSILDLKISASNFYDELGEAMTYYDVLEEWAKYLGCCFTPYGEDLYLLDYAAIKAGYNSYTKLDGLTETTVTLSDAKTVTNYRGTGAKISRIAGKNKAVVNCSLYEIKNILPEFSEKGATFSNIVGSTTYSEGEYTGIIRKYSQPKITLFHYAGGNPASMMESSNPVSLNNSGSSFVRTTEYKTTEPPSALSMVSELQVKTYVNKTDALAGKHLTSSSPVLKLTSPKPILVHSGVHFCINLMFKKQTKEFTRSDDRPETFAAAGFVNQKAKFRIGDYYYNGTEWTTTESTFGMRVIYEEGGKTYGTYRSLENTNSFETGLGDLTGYVFQAPSFPIFGECELTLYCIESSPVSPLREFGIQYVYYKDIQVDYSIPNEASIWDDWVDKDSKNDLIYENEISGDYIEEAEEIDLKICTNPDGKLALSSVLEGEDGFENFNTKLVSDVYGEKQAEEILIDRVIDLYNAPRFVIDPTLANDAKPYTVFTEPHLDETFMVAGGEEDVKMERCTYNLVEI
jgi:hypothetical protein